VQWREEVAGRRRASFINESYWGRPVPGFGDPDARLLVLGLAPAAHGGNRTGRVFTGDRSGDWLYRALHRAGYANQPTSVSADDGLVLRDCFVTAAVRCAPPANKPTPEERDRCLCWLGEEVKLLPHLRAVLALGAFAWDGAVRTFAPGLRRKPRFAHESEVDLGSVWLIGSYHVSQQNTFTGKLTEEMLDSAVRRAGALSRLRPPSR
jgi:uracil-DNA glycosylase